MLQHDNITEMFDAPAQALSAAGPNLRYTGGGKEGGAKRWGTAALAKATPWNALHARPSACCKTRLPDDDCKRERDRPT